MMDSILNQSPHYHQLRARSNAMRTAFGDDPAPTPDPPHVDDVWVSMEDSVEYAEYVDKQVKKLEKAFSWWQGGADLPKPQNITTANTAGQWASSGWAQENGAGGNFLSWVAGVWNPFIKKMREGSWLPFGATWTRLNSWDVIQKHHREVKAGAARATKLGLPAVPDVGNPEAKGPIEKLGEGANAVVTPFLWLGAGFLAFMVVKELRSK